MKIIVDDKIPYISSTLECLADEVVYLPGSKITAADVRDADALIIRTRTRCNETLLNGSSVQFIATATIGFDHIDTNYCERAGIYWTNCPGCNADSVNQYIRECLRLLLEDGKVAAVEKDGALYAAPHTKIAVIGYGHVGSRVAKTAEEMGFAVLVSDPPLFGEGLRDIRDIKDSNDLKETNNSNNLKETNDSKDLNNLNDCKVITFHTPLTFEGPHNTFHLADEAFFKSLKNAPVIINSSRGEVVDNQALLKALETGLVSEAILDVWENEPDILLPLLEKTYIATPHIAGYSANGKVNADNMVVEALCKHFHLPLPAKIVPPAAPVGQTSADGLLYTTASKYNPRDDHNRFVANPSDFEKLRGDYPIRLE